MKHEWALKYKNILISVHVLLLLFLVVDIFLVNLKGVWVDRLIVVCFLLTASGIFAMYKKTLRILQKIYFGFFLFYPVIAATTFLMDRIMFVVVASPLLVSLTIPATRFSNKDFDIREQVGPLAAMRLQLIKKGLLTEKAIGTCSNGDIVYREISSIQVTSQMHDTTKVIITSLDEKFEATFTK
jgi:hypothetical protein